MSGAGTCKMPTRRWNWTLIGANTKWAEVAIVFVWKCVRWAAAINWQLQHSSRSETWDRDSSNWIVELERSLAYRAMYLWHIGKKSDILYSRRSDILISSWRASQISIKLTKIRPEKEKADCISIWLYFPKNILAAGSIAQGWKWTTEIRYNSTSSNKAHYLQEA